MARLNGWGTNLKRIYRLMCGRGGKGYAVDEGPYIDFHISWESATARYGLGFLIKSCVENEIITLDKIGGSGNNLR